MKKWNLILFFKEYYPIIIVIGLFLFIGYKWFDRSSKKAKVLNNPVFTVGKIIKYSELEDIYYVTYEYSVNDIEYSRETSIGGRDRFPGCRHDISICYGERFWVAYQKDDPSNSLINVYIELGNLKNPREPASLENFE